MIYEFIGKITQVSERSGQSAKGPWKMWECVMQHDLGGQFPSFVQFEVWDEQMGNSIAIWKGSNLTVKMSAYINAREYNGKWFNTIRANRVEPMQQPQQIQQPVQPMMQQQTIPYQQMQQPYGANAGGYPQQQGYGGHGVDPNTGLPF